MSSQYKFINLSTNLNRVFLMKQEITKRTYTILEKFHKIMEQETRKMNIKLFYLSLQFNWLSRNGNKHSISSFCSLMDNLTNNRNYITCRLSLTWAAFLSLFLSFWSANCSWIHQWPWPSLDMCFWIWEICGTEWDIRWIKNRIDVMWRTQRVAKCPILVRRRKFLAFALCICMSY